MSRSATPAEPFRIGIIMGSESDWETMRGAAEMLTEFGCAHEIEIVSAHRTPERLFEYARSAVERGLAAIIAGAGGAAHLPGMVSSLTPLPVLGVPVKSQALAGLDSLLSIVQMPAGVPTATFAIGVAGAKNAALFCVRMLALHDARLREALIEFRDREAARVEAGSERLRKANTKDAG